MQASLTMHVSWPLMIQLKSAVAWRGCGHPPFCIGLEGRGASRGACTKGNGHCDCRSEFVLGAPGAGGVDK